MKVIAFSLLLTVMLVGCKTTPELPLMLGEGTCLSGNCDNGYGKVSSPLLNISYEGNWSEGKVQSGLYKVSLNNQKLTASYEDGQLVSGVGIFPHYYAKKSDYFVGKWKTYYHPFTDGYASFPSEGIYYSITGATYTGKFYAIPTSGASQVYLQENPSYKTRLPAANIVFAGKISFSGESEVVVLARENYTLGMPLVSAKGVSLAASDMQKIGAFKKGYQQELNTIERAKQREAASQFDFTELLAFAGAAASVAYGVDSGLTSDSAANFGVGVYQAFSEGDVTKLNEAEQNLEYRKSDVQFKRELNAKVTEIERKYANSNSRSHAFYQEGVVRSEANKSRLNKGEPTQHQLASNHSTSAIGGQTASVSSTASTQLAATESKTAAVPSSANTINSLSKEEQKSSYFLRIEAVAYCNMKKGGWKCDGPSGWSIGSRVKDLSNALDRSGCRNPSSRQNAFRANEHLDERYLEGRIVYCGFPLNSYNATLAQKYSLPNKGSDAYDRDIAKKYSLPNRLLVTRNIYKTQTPMAATSELYQTANGLVQNIVEKIE